MSVCFYDRALTEKFKKWTEGLNKHFSKEGM